jgi:hypothetical protein
MFCFDELDFECKLCYNGTMNTSLNISEVTNVPNVTAVDSPCDCSPYRLSISLRPEPSIECTRKDQCCLGCPVEKAAACDKRCTKIGIFVLNKPLGVVRTLGVLNWI